MGFKLILSILFLFLIGFCVFAIAVSPDNHVDEIEDNYIQVDNQENKLYEGPVPEGYDEEYFRETGITKPTE